MTLAPARTRLAVAALVLLILLSPWLYDVAHAEELSYDAVYSYAAEAFGPGWLAHKMTRVAWCESNWITGADTNWPYVGLWQEDINLHGVRTVGIFGRWRSLYEPRVNAFVAASIYRDQGGNAWPYCFWHS